MLDDGARVEPKAIMTPPLDLENLITVSTPVFSNCLQSGETRGKEKKRAETDEGNGETRKRWTKAEKDGQNLNFHRKFPKFRRETLKFLKLDQPPRLNQRSNVVCLKKTIHCNNNISKLKNTIPQYK